MTSLAAIWLPILLSAVAVFVVSSIVHMLTPWHKGDYPAIPREDEVMAALRPFNLPPGDYMVPRPPTRAALRSPAFLEKLKSGPVLVATVMPNGMMNMGTRMAQWFVYLLVVIAFAALVASRFLAPGAGRHAVFHAITAMSFMSFALALAQMAIWYRRGWGLTLKSMFDGLIYAVVTGLIFAYLWPR